MRECCGGNGSRWISASQSLREPLRLRHVAIVSEKSIDVHEPGARQHAFVAHMTKLAAQREQQRVLDVILRREVHMPAFRRSNLIRVTVPRHERDAKPGARSDERERAMFSGWATF